MSCHSRWLKMFAPCRKMNRWTGLGRLSWLLGVHLLQGPMCVFLCLSDIFLTSGGGGGGGGVGCPGNPRPLRVMNVPLHLGLLQVVGPNDPSHFTKWARQRAACCINPSIRESLRIFFYSSRSHRQSAFCWRLFLFR